MRDGRMAQKMGGKKHKKWGQTRLGKKWGQTRIKHPAASYGVLTSLFKPLAFASLRSKERGIEPEEIKRAKINVPLRAAQGLHHRFKRAVDEIQQHQC